MKTTSYQKNIIIKMPHRYNTDIQSLKAGFIKKGGNITAQVENSGKRQWNLVDLESHDILPNSATLLLACLLLAP